MITDPCLIKPLKVLLDGTIPAKAGTVSLDGIQFD